VIPITAIIAIILFLVRELIVSVKKRKNEEKVIKAIKMLLAEEVKENYATFTIFCKILDDFINSEKELKPQSINTDRHKNDWVQYYESQQKGHSFKDVILRNFNFKYYENHISDLALLDMESFEKIQKTYELFRTIQGERDKFVCYLANEMKDTSEEILKGTLRLVTYSQDGFKKEINDLHKKLVNKDISNKSLLNRNVK